LTIWFSGSICELQESFNLVLQAWLLRSLHSPPALVSSTHPEIFKLTWGISILQSLCACLSTQGDTAWRCPSWQPGRLNSVHFTCACPGQNSLICALEFDLTVDGLKVSKQPRGISEVSQD